MKFRPLFLALVLLLLAAPCFAANDGTRVREFLAELVSAGGVQDSAVRAQQVRQAVLDYEDLAPKLLDPDSAKQIFTDSGLSALVKINFTDKTLGYSDVAQAVLQAIPKEQQMELLKKIPDSAIGALSDRLDSRLGAITLSKVPAIEKVLDQLHTIKLNGFKQSDLDFLVRSFVGYFDQSPPTIKRRMIAAWLRVPAGAGWEEQLEAILQNAGPGLQKLFQMIGRESKSKELTRISTKLLSKVRPVPFEQIKATIEREQGKPLAEIFSSFDEKPLAAGTVGQMHPAVTKDGREIVEKVLRPGIKTEMTEELDLMLSLTQANKPSHELLKHAKESFLEELDLREEAHNIGKLASYTDPSKGLAVPNVVNSVPPTVNTLAEERAAGKTLEKAGAIDPRIRAQAVAAVTDKWFDESLRQGNFHGDLHAGNIMIEERPFGPVPYQATFVDFGAVGKLSIEQRRGIFLLYAAVDGGSSAHVLEALEQAFAHVPEETRQELEKEIRAILAAKGTAAQKMNEVIGVALKEGLELDKNVEMFSRSTFMLSRELERTNQEILLRFPGAKVTKPAAIFRRVAIRSLGRDVWNGVTAGGENGVWNWEVLKRMAAEQLGKPIRRIGNTCELLYSRIRNGIFGPHLEPSAGP